MSEESKCLVAVAKGDKYERQTEGMISGFLRYNPGWHVERFYGKRIDEILPEECIQWNDFSKCELGRWLAVRACLGKYGTVVYCDGDMRWYGRYDTCLEHSIVLSPHYITDNAKRAAKHWIMKDGAANLGLFEVSRSPENDELFDYIIGEVLHNPRAFMHGDQLWLQNLASTLPDCGFDAVYSDDPSVNVASWNLRMGDRIVVERDGACIVGCGGLEYPLKSFHFSSKSLGSLPKYGPGVQRLLKEYANGH